MRQCQHSATVTRDGKHYCKQHDPVVKAQRAVARDKACAERLDARRVDYLNQQLGAEVRKLFPEGTLHKSMMKWARDEEKKGRKNA